MFNFENLDEKTRGFMLEAISEAETSGNIYFSTRFNDAGFKEWLSLLKEAAKEHDEHWLAYQLEAKRLMKGFEGASTPSGGYTVKHTPHTAAETMAEGQFNRFYILGVCKRAREEDIPQLEIYRAKKSLAPRRESENLIGSKISVDYVEAQLFKTSDSFKSPLLKPNSGLSMRLP
jgi:hypothetical protein